MADKPVSQIVAISGENGQYRAGVTSGGRLMVDASGGGSATDSNITQVGSNPVVTGGQNGLLAVAGNVANDGVDAGNPVKIGGVVSGSPTAVASGDRVDAWLTSQGAFVIGAVNKSGADGVPNSDLRGLTGPTTATTGLLQVAPSVYNPTTGQWDRTRNTGVVGGAQLMELGPYVFVRATTDAAIKLTAGFIHTISIAPTGSVAAGVLTVYNSTAESGAVIFSVALPATTFTPFTITLDVACSIGIYVGFDGTLANVNATVSFR